MFYVLQNESTAARRRVPILLTDAATGTTAQTGVATTTIFPYVNINGNAFIGGTGNVGEAGFGQYYYEFEANEVATLGLAGIHITAAGCRDYDAITQVAAFDVYSASAGGGISAYDVWQFDASTFSNLTEAGGLLNAAYLSASSADSNANAANNQTVNIAAQVWGDDLGAGPNSPYAAGTAGSILYDLSLGGTALTAGDVWDYASRTITGGIADTVQLVATPVEISYPSMAGLANTIWSTDISGYTSPSAGFDLANASSGSGISAHDVWDFVITGFGQTGSAALYATQTNFTVGNIETYVQNQTPQDVWTYAGIEGRTITGGIADTVTTLTDRSGFAITGGTITTVSDKTGYSLSSTQTFDLTGNITGNLSGSVGSVTNPVDVSTSSMSGIANTVWSTDVSGYSSPSAGYDLSNATAGGGITAGDVWSYTLSNALTAEDTLVSIPTDISNVYSDTQNIYGDTQQILSDISGLPGQTTSDVWNYTLGNAVSADTNLVNAASGAGLTAGDVWTYATREITGGIADTVTSVSNGVIVTTNNDKTGYALSSSQTFDLTGNITGNLSGSVGNVTNPVTFDSAQYSAIASSVWNAGTRTLTSSGSGLTAGDVWSYATRTITGGIADTVTTVSGNVLGSVNSVVTDVPVDESLVSADVWSYATRTLTSGGSGISAADVWTYGSRTITGGIADTVTTVTDRSGFAITGGTITTVSDKTGYSLSGSQSFNLTGNITGDLSGNVGSVTSPVTVGTNNDKTGYALSAGGVTAVQSGLSTLTQAQVGTEVDSSLSDVGLTTTVTGRIDATVSSRLASASYTAPPTEAAIAGTVWSYSPRTLTSGAGATAGDVWTYPTRSLTSGAGITVNAATNIINGPYFVKSNVDSQDGTLDVIKGMVQDIQLTVTDAFQNPFDTTALGLAVNFYDQAGTLTTSYGTTELYGPAGLVQFTLDTAVTANEGRYNLILSAAGSGNTIKFGPLQTLVRPF
jgi:hypothetical protein